MSITGPLWRFPVPVSTLSDRALREYGAALGRMVAVDFQHHHHVPSWDDIQRYEQHEWHESWWHDAYVWSPNRSVDRSPDEPAVAGVTSQTPQAAADVQAPATAYLLAVLGEAD